jgi:hypothetical protein
VVEVRRLIRWVRARKGILLLVLGGIFVVFVTGIQSGLVGPNDPIAIPLALGFVFLLLVVLLA